MNENVINKNIDKMTNKEKVVFIQTLLGVSAKMAHFLADCDLDQGVSIPSEIHYCMLLSFLNFVSLSKENETPEMIDYSAKVDSSEDKLISFLKFLNEVYKEKLV